MNDNEEKANNVEGKAADIKGNSDEESTTDGAGHNGGDGEEGKVGIKVTVDVDAEHEKAVYLNMTTKN